MKTEEQGKFRWIALLVVLSAPLLSVTDFFIINIAIPAIRKGVQATEAEVLLPKRVSLEPFSGRTVVCGFRDRKHDFALLLRKADQTVRQGGRRNGGLFLFVSMSLRITFFHEIVFLNL